MKGKCVNENCQKLISFPKYCPKCTPNKKQK